MWDFLAEGFNLVKDFLSCEGDLGSFAHLSLIESPLVDLLFEGGSDLHRGLWWFLTLGGILYSGLWFDSRLCFIQISLIRGSVNFSDALVESFVGDGLGEA